MDVIAVGFGRTGTLSLKTALERLGYGPCHHMFEVIGDVRATRRWTAAADSPPGDWAGLLGGYRSCTDWPSCYFWRELVAAYPEAKVVLTVRDPGEWYASMRRMLDAATSAVGDSEGVPPVSLLYLATLVDRLVWQGTFNGRINDRDHAMSIFDRHTAEVTATVPSDRLLVYEVAQGWGPLCAFLDVPVPSTPFPRLNDTEAFRTTIMEKTRAPLPSDSTPR